MREKINREILDHKKKKFSKKEKLKDCPFCHSNKIQIYKLCGPVCDVSHECKFSMICDNCFSRGPQYSTLFLSGNLLKKECIKLWNDRSKND